MKPVSLIYLITCLAGLGSLLVSVVLLTGSGVSTNDYILATMSFLLFLTLPGVAVFFHLLYDNDELLLNQLSI